MGFRRVPSVILAPAGLERKKAYVEGLTMTNPGDGMKGPAGESFRRLMDTQGKQLGLGPTGKMPEGKVSDDDKGELALALILDKDKKLIHMHFGTPVTWFSMTPQLANDIANVLLQRAKELGHAVEVKI